MTKTEMERFAKVIGKTDPATAAFIVHHSLDCDNCGLKFTCPWPNEFFKMLSKEILDSDLLNSCEDIIRHYISTGSILKLRRDGK